MNKTVVKATVQMIGVVPRPLDLTVFESSMEGRSRRYHLRIEDGMHTAVVPLPNLHKPKLINVFRALRRVLSNNAERTIQDEDFGMLWTNLVGTKATAFLMPPENTQNLIGPWAVNIIRPRYKLRVGGADNTISYLYLSDVLISAVMQIYQQNQE